MCNSNVALVTIVLISMRYHGIITQDEMSSLFWGRMAGTRDLNSRILGGYFMFIGEESKTMLINVNLKDIYQKRLLNDRSPILKGMGKEAVSKY